MVEEAETLAHWKGVVKATACHELFCEIQLA
jgi:hypothetical protein